MLLVLASIADQYVGTGVAHLRTLGLPTEVITAHDLAQPGWKLTLDGDDPVVVVGGKQVAVKELHGVITRIAGVTAAEVPFMHEADRAYAAAEMNAFLVALLTRLRCPILNRPTPACLCGPSWAREQWVAAAARAKVPVRPARRRAFAGGLVDADPEPPRTVVHVVCGSCTGEPDPTMRAHAVAVANEAGTDLLRVWFDVSGPTPVFFDADAWVDVSDIAVATAIRGRFK